MTLRRAKLVALLLLAACAGYAQQNPNEYYEAPPELLRNEVSFGLTLHSNGWGIDFRRGRNLTVSRKRMLEIEFVGMHHPKEIKSVNPLYENSKSYVLGKVNSMSVLRGALGEQRVIAGKAERGGVELRLNYTGGLSLGLVKPVYLNIIRDSQNDPGIYSVSTERYDPDDANHSQEYIYGRAAFTRGLDELRFYPGLYAKLGISFEFGAYDDDVKIIEVGITADAYHDKIEIMRSGSQFQQEVKNNQLFFNFYINWIYGRKW
jgi:hypothetical protein